VLAGTTRRRSCEGRGSVGEGGLVGCLVDGACAGRWEVLWKGGVYALFVRVYLDRAGEEGGLDGSRLVKCKDCHFVIALRCSIPQGSTLS